MTATVTAAGPPPEVGAPRVHIGTLLTWMLVSLVGVYLVFVVGGFPGIYQVQWRLVTHGLTLLVVVGWLLAILWRPGLFVLPRLTLPIGAVLGAMVVSTLASPYPRFGWETVINATATALVFAALVTMLARPALRPRLRFTAAALVVGVVVGYAVQILGLWVEFWSIVGSITTPPLRPAFAGLIYGTPSIPAGVVVAFLPLVVAWAVGSSLPRAVRWVAAVALAVIGLFDVVASGSRGAQLGVGVAVLVGAALLATERPQAITELRDRLSQRRTRVSVLVALLFLFGTAVALGPRILARAVDMGGNLRLTYWEHSVAAFADAPMTGTGPGTWAFAQWAYRDDVRQLDVVAHAHNAPIQLAAEMGIVGLVAGAVFVLGVVLLLRRAWLRLPRLEVIAVAMGLAGLAAQCLVDNFSDLPLFVAGVAFLLAWLESGLRSWATIRTRLVFAGAAATLIGVIAVGVLVILPWDRAAAAYLDGVRAQDAAHWTRAVDAYAKAVALDSDYPQYHAALGVAADWAGDPARAADELAAGVALNDDPFMAIQAALATLTAGGSTDRAASLLAQATDAGAVNVDLALDAGAVAERLGLRAKAIHHYATAIALQPGLMGSPYWLSSERPASAQAVAGAAVGRLAELELLDSDPIATEIAIWAGIDDWAKAGEVAGRLVPGIRRDALVAWLAAMQGKRTGLEELRAMNRAEPWSVISLLATAADRLGDPEADRYRRWVALIYGGSDGGARTPVLAQGGGEKAIYLDVSPAISEEVYLRDRGVVTQVLAALQVAYR